MSQGQPLQYVEYRHILEHEPHFKDGHLVGCSCQWEASQYDCRPDWVRYCDHLPRVDHGHLVLSPEDIEFLRHLDAAFEREALRWHP